MGNICTNIFYCKTDNEDNLKTINDFISEAFGWDFCNEDDNDFKGEFDSQCCFPKKEFEEMMSKLQQDDTLYMYILSHEFGNEYVSFRVYEKNQWNVKI